MSRTPDGWSRRVYWTDTNDDRITLAAIVYAESGNLAMVRRTTNLDHVAQYANHTTEGLNAMLDGLVEYLASVDLFQIHTYGLPKTSPLQLGKPEHIYSDKRAAHLFPLNLANAITTGLRGSRGKEEADIEWIYGPIETLCEETV